MRTTIQEQMPAWYFARYRRPLVNRDLDQALCWAERACRQLRRSAEREFEGRGIEIAFQDLTFGGVRVRARLNLKAGKVYIDPAAEADLFQELDRLGFPLSPSPKQLILTHELFHLFCPRCPSALEELAAHLFCASVLELDYFPGLLDLGWSYPQSAAG